MLHRSANRVAIFGDKKYKVYRNGKYKIKLWNYQNQSLGVITIVKTCSTVQFMV